MTWARFFGLGWAATAVVLAYVLVFAEPSRDRVEVRVWGDPTVFDAGELEVRAPVTSDVTLVPRARGSRGRPAAAGQIAQASVWSRPRKAGERVP